MGGPWVSLGVLGEVLGVLGRSLGGPLGVLGGSLVGPWEVLGGPWGILGGSLGVLGGSQESPWGSFGAFKNIEKTLVFMIFPANGAIGESLGVSLGVLVEILSIPVGTWGVPGRYLGALGALGELLRGP